MIANVKRWVFDLDTVSPVELNGYLDGDIFTFYNEKLDYHFRYSSDNCFRSKQEAIDSKIKRLESELKELRCYSQ